MLLPSCSYSASLVFSLVSLKSTAPHTTNQDKARTLDEREAAAAAAAAADAASTLPRRLSNNTLAAEPSDLSANAPITINSRQHRTVSALLASLQQTAARGAERLQRLERVLNTIAADAAEPERVRSAYMAVLALGRELVELQQSNAEFAAALDAAGTRGELAEVKRRLEAHQQLLGSWEEKVGRQLEAITELQSPSKRTSMMLTAPARVSGMGPQSAPVSPALWGGGGGGGGAAAGLIPRRSAFTPGPSMLGGDGGGGQ